MRKSITRRSPAKNVSRGSSFLELSLPYENKNIPTRLYFYEPLTEGPSTRDEELFPKIYLRYPRQSKDIYSGELEEVSNVNINFTNTTVFLFLVVIN